MPASPSTRPDGLLDQSSVTENRALYSTSAVPQLEPEDEIWGDLGLGVAEDWDLTIPSMTWTP